ncbi:MAG: DMT family transporter [Ruthenibacterium sp.]
MGYLILAAILCSIGGVCIRLIPWTPLAINGARCAIAACVTGVYLRRQGVHFHGSYPVVCGALSLCLTTNLYVFSSKLAGAACAVLLLYTAPIWVLLYSVVIQKQPLQPRAVGCCALVFGGVCLLAANGLRSGTAFGVLLGLCSGIAYAGVFLYGAQCGKDAVSAYFLGQIAGAAIGLPFLATERDFSPTPLLCALLLGVFQLGLSYVCMARGLLKTPAVTASIITALEPALTPIWVAIFCKEIPPVSIIFGAAVILCGVLLHQTGQKSRPPNSIERSAKTFTVL